MPINASRGNATSRAYGFAGRRKRPPEVITFSPSANAQMYYQPIPTQPGANYAIMRITGSGTLNIDPWVPISGPTQFRMYVVAVGGGGGGGTRSISVSPPTGPYYPRAAWAPGGGGGGGVSQALPYFATTRSIPVVIGGGGSSGNPGNPSSFGPLAVPPINPSQTSANGGGGGGGGNRPTLDGYPNTISGSGYYKGGSGGGAARGIMSSSIMPTPLGPVVTYPVQTSVGAAGTKSLEGGWGTAGVAGTFYLDPTNPATSTALGFVGGHGGGSSTSAVNPNFGGIGVPITRGAEGGGTIEGWTGQQFAVGGGGAGGITFAPPETAYLAAFGPTIDQASEAYSNGNGGTYFLGPTVPINAPSNSGGGGGGLPTPAYSVTISPAMPSFFFGGGNGGSGVVYVRWPVPSTI